MVSHSFKVVQDFVHPQYLLPHGPVNRTLRLPYAVRGNKPRPSLFKGLMPLPFFSNPIPFPWFSVKEIQKSEGSSSPICPILSVACCKKSPAKPHRPRTSRASSAQGLRSSRDPKPKWGGKGKRPLSDFWAGLVVVSTARRQYEPPQLI